MPLCAQRIRWSVALPIVAFALCGCTETTITQVNKPFFTGINNAGGLRSLQNTPTNGAEQAPILDPRVLNPDGTITLNSPTIRALLRHILETIANEEENIFTDQLLSKITKREFTERGFDPVEAHREMTRRKDDIRALFRAMPAGEYTPGVLMQNAGKNTFRLAIKGDPSLRWSFIDVVLERGQYKLRWFGRQ